MPSMGGRGNYHVTYRFLMAGFNVQWSRGAGPSGVSTGLRLVAMVTWTTVTKEVV